MQNELPNNCVLAVDIGTTALKAAVINASGKVLDYSRIEFSNNKSSKEWYLALKDACAKMKDAVQNVRAICVSGNGPTIVFADGTTILWNTNEGLSNYTGKSIFLPKILMAKKLYPTLWQSEQKIFSGPEFLVNQLCGAEVTILPEPRFESAYWSEHILNALQIPREKICAFAPPTKTLGNLKPEIAKELNLPKDIPVICAGPDFIAALVGTNTLSAGALCDRAGSSEGINFCTPHPIEAKGIRTLPSVVEKLWNASYLIQDPGSTIEEKAAHFAKGIETLKAACGEIADTIIITGGQGRNEDVIQAKADAANIKIGVQQIADAELLGDAAFAFTALGEFDSIQSAANAICKTTKIFYPKNARE